MVNYVSLSHMSVSLCYHENFSSQFLHWLSHMLYVTCLQVYVTDINIAAIMSQYYLIKELASELTQLFPIFAVKTIEDT